MKSNFFTIFISNKIKFYFSLLRAAGLAIISPVSGVLAVALAVADYAHDIENCNSALERCL